jgi:uncharacterized hydantoinase/oxoprolinase family protein
MSRESNSGAPMAIFLASLVLIAITAKAEEKMPKNENLRLIWTSDCPKGVQTNYNLCKKRIYADDSIDLKKLKWEEVEDIAKVAYDWKQRFKIKIKK